MTIAPLDDDWKGKFSIRFKPPGRHHNALRREVLDPIWARVNRNVMPHDFEFCADLMCDIFNRPGGREVGCGDAYWHYVFGVPKGWIATVRPTLFLDEADPNQHNEPRLDIVATLKDGCTVRFHPSAFLIASWHPAFDQAITSRRNCALKLPGGTNHR